MKDLLELKENVLESFIIAWFVYRPHLDSESEDVIFAGGFVDSDEGENFTPKSKKNKKAKAKDKSGKKDVEKPRTEENKQDEEEEGACGAEKRR